VLSTDSLNVFPLDDDSIFFQGGQAFVNNARYHILPNKRLMYEDLLTIPVGTGFATLLKGQRLMVTSTIPFFDQWGRSVVRSVATLDNWMLDCSG